MLGFYSQTGRHVDYVVVDIRLDDVVSGHSPHEVDEAGLNDVVPGVARIGDDS